MSNRSVSRLSPRLLGLDVASAGILLLILAMFVAALTLQALDLNERFFICVEPPPCEEPIVRYMVGVREGAIPFLDLSLALAFLGVLAIAAGTVHSVRRSRPASLVVGAFGIGLSSVAVVGGFGMTYGFRRFARWCGPAVLETSCVRDEANGLGVAWADAVEGLWFFLIVGTASLAALAASFALGRPRPSRVG